MGSYSVILSLMLMWTMIIMCGFLQILIQEKLMISLITNKSISALQIILTMLIYPYLEWLTSQHSSDYPKKRLSDYP